MRHRAACPVAALGAKDDACTCGAGIPILAPAPQVLPHTDGCPCRITPCQPPCRDCTCGVVLPPDVVQEAGAPKVTDDNPYRDVERSRSLAEQAQKAFDEGYADRAMFLLALAQEARLLAELQGKWEY